MLHVVLFQPEIPHNTGAIGRLCLATGARLHLIGPLGFSLEDKYLKRAGLDYWQEVDTRQWPSWEAFHESTASEARFCLIECGGPTPYWQAPMDCQTSEELYLVFGPETRGIPPSLLKLHEQAWFHIPMMENSARSLNLATAVAIVLYEAVRQRSK